MITRTAGVAFYLTIGGLAFNVGNVAINSSDSLPSTRMR